MNKYIIDNGSIDLSNLIDFLKKTIIKRIRLIIIFILLNCIGLIFGAAKYNASVSFYTDYRETSSSSLSFFDEIISSQGVLRFNIANFIESDRFLEEIVQKEYHVKNNKITLAKHWYGKDSSLANPITLLKKIDNSLHLKPNISKSELEIHKAKIRLSEKLKHREDRKTGLHTLSISIKKHPDLALRIIDDMYKSILDYSNDVTSIKALEKKKFVESRVAELKTNLEKKEQELIDFINNNRNVLESPILSLQKERIERDIALYGQLYIRLSDELEIAKIDEKDNTSSIFLLQEPFVSDRKSGPHFLVAIIKSIIFILFAVITVEVLIKRKRIINL